MKSKTLLKPCPFCGAEVQIRKGINNITLFQCSNEKCYAIISFGSDLKDGRYIVYLLCCTECGKIKKVRIR